MAMGSQIADITVDFGPKLDEKDQNFIVSAASALKAYLFKNYKLLGRLRTPCARKNEK
jgi:hypothetical protein